MNVEDKGSLYASVARVLKPGAPFVLFDILSAGAEEPQYPAPWAATPEQSFLATADEMSAHLERAGFSIIEIKDQTSEAIAFLDIKARRISSRSTPATNCTRISHGLTATPHRRVQKSKDWFPSLMKRLTFMRVSNYCLGRRHRGPEIEPLMLSVRREHKVRINNRRKDQCQA